MSDQLILVACGARKAESARAAADLYTGSYTRMCLHAARTLAAEIEPYDTTLSDTTAITAEQLHDQAAAAGLLHRNVIVLGGAGYTRLVREVWQDAAAPLLGSRGIGEHRQRLARIISG